VISPPKRPRISAIRMNNEKRRTMNYFLEKPRPDVSRNCGDRGGGAHQTRGAGVAHTKACFVVMTRVKIVNSERALRTMSGLSPITDPLDALFHRNPLGKPLLDNFHLRLWHSLLGSRQGDRLIVVRFELSDLLALFEIRRN
jgi:hypothetical protein